MLYVTKLGVPVLSSVAYISTWFLLQGWEVRVSLK